MTVLPVRAEDVQPEGAMEFALGNSHWLDAFSPPVERRLEFLARSVWTLKPVGSWNEMQVEVRGSIPRVSVNGSEIRNTDLSVLANSVGALPGD